MHTTHQRGAWGEALAMAHLLAEGFEVFTSSLSQASCDMIALRRGEMWRVEVKTARPMKTPTGKLTPKPHIGKATPELYDMLLVVLEDGTVLCNPTRDQVHGLPLR